MEAFIMFKEILHWSILAVYQWSSAFDKGKNSGYCAESKQETIVHHAKFVKKLLTKSSLTFQLRDMLFEKTPLNAENGLLKTS